MTNTPNSPAPRSAVYATQEAQHGTIRELLADLLQSGSAQALRPLLARMETLLPEHFEHEEADGGVFAGILEEDPMLGGDIDRFVEDHKRFLERLATARGTLDTDPTAAVALAHQLGRDLADHEEQENALMMNALYEDMGTKD